LVGWGPADGPERDAEGVALRDRQSLERGHVLGAQLLGRGVGELALGLVPDGAQGLEPAGRLGRIGQQSRLADAGLAVNHDGVAPSRAGRIQQAVDDLALVRPPEQHWSGPLWSLTGWASLTPVLDDVKIAQGRR
jgi:hypothetical protein